jgi:hypothetical protein
VARTKKSITKAARVRQYREKHPESTPKQIADALRDYGVTAQYVSMLKVKDRQRAGKDAVPPIATNATTSPAVPVDAMVSAAKLIQQCGGIEHAREALDAAAEVASVFR